MEHTREENQERAYISASRRSVRSLEARMVSAQKASEIHKKRTGKGLKVTERHIVDQEIYEEEDSELPRHYRHLKAQYMTNLPTLETRLDIYLANDEAFKIALKQIMAKTASSNNPFSHLLELTPNSKFTSPSPSQVEESCTNNQVTWQAKKYERLCPLKQKKIPYDVSKPLLEQYEDFKINSKLPNCHADNYLFTSKCNNVSSDIPAYDEIAKKSTRRTFST